MNTVTALDSQPHAMSNGRHLDISPRTFVDRYSALGFERKITHDGNAFVHHVERIIVAPVLTECGSIDRWHTVRRLEDTLTLHRAKRRGQGTLTAIALAFVALLVAMLWPHIVRAESKQAVLEHAYDDSFTSAAPLARCDLAYTLAPHESTVLQCTHRLRGLEPVERYRSGHARVLISPAATVSRGDAVLVVLFNTGDQPATGTATVEFW